MSKPLVRLNKRTFNSRIKRSQKFKAPKVQAEKVKKKKSKDENGCVTELTSNYGNLTRGDNHAYWGYRYMAGKCDAKAAGITDSNRHNERLEIYNIFTHVKKGVYDDEIRKEIKANFKFPSSCQSPANFCKQAKNKSKYSGQAYPYRWQSHHILPHELFNTKKASMKIFNATEKKLLTRAGYNINHGHNIIFMPGNGAINYVPVHGLVQHATSHDKYSQTARNQLKDASKDIKDELEKAKDKANKDKHAEILAGVVQLLREVEQDLWEELVEACSDAVGKAIKKQSHSSKFIGAKDGWLRLS